MLRKFLYISFVSVFIFCFSCNSYAEKRVALIIGNSEYNSEGYNSLTQPVNDAEAFDKALQSLGFETILLKNGNLQQMMDSLSNFVSILESADVAVFYYSGHGNSLNNLDYIVPAKTKFRNVALSSQFLSLYDIEQEMKRKSKLSFIFYDACRNNPNSEISISSQSKGFIDSYRSNQLIICYATAPGKTASAGNGAELSPFTEVLIDNIYKQEEFRTLWHNHISTDKRLVNQVPQIIGGYSENFYFNLPKKRYVISENNTYSESKLNNKSDDIFANIDYFITQLDFKSAIGLLNEIPNSNNHYEEVKEKIKKYSFFQKEQEEGRVVSQKLAKSIASYNSLELFFNGYSRLATVLNNQITNGFVSTKGDVFWMGMLPKEYSHFSNGMAYCSDGQNYLTHLVDSNLNSIGLYYRLDGWGKTWSYCSDRSFSGGLLAVQNIESGKWGYIDKEGYFVIKCKYDFASEFTPYGLAFVRKGNKCYFINKKGKIVIKGFKNDYGTSIAFTTDAFAWIRYKSEDNKYVMTAYWGDKFNSFPKNFSKNGIDVIVDYILPSSYDTSCVKAHYIDNNGKERDFYFFLHGDCSLLYNFEMFDKATSFCEERAIVWKDGQCGVIDLDGNVIIPYGKFDSIDDFQNGLSVTTKNGKYGFIDKEGNVVIDFIYDNAKPFTDVFALVSKNGRIGFVDKYGFCTITVDVTK